MLALWWTASCTGGDQELTDGTVVGSAWGVATAAASFCWNGHAGEDPLVLKGEEGLPFFDDRSNRYTNSAKELDFLSDVMNDKVEFFKMTPQDILLSSHDTLRVWSLAEAGEQYLVFSTAGDSFNLQVKAGQYSRVEWIDARSGTAKLAPAVTIASDQVVSLPPPTTNSDWVLIHHH